MGKVQLSREHLAHPLLRIKDTVVTTVRMAIEDAENGEHADIRQGMAVKNISTGPLVVQQSINKLGMLSHSGF